MKSSDNRSIALMGMARDEIRHLRRVVDELAPKAEAYDALRQVIGLIPRQAQGYGEDVARSLDIEIEKLTAAQKTTEPAFVADDVGGGV